MEFTGERAIPGEIDPDLFNEHLARYRLAQALVSSRRVLDAGCGVGYGSAELARRAAEVVALDKSLDAVRRGARDYPMSNLRFVEADCRAAPFPDASFDVVVAFEVIEHLEDWRGLIEEAGRLLKPEGQFLVSTPNRLYYSETREEPNPFHVHEFDYQEFRAALESVFEHTTIFLENHTNAIAFRAPEVQGVRTCLEGESPPPEDSHFFLAVCSRRPQYGSPAFLFVPDTGNVLREREHHIDKLADELRRKTEWLERATRELEELTELHRTEQEKAQQVIDELEEENRVKTEWAEQGNRDVEERTLWAHKLEEELQQAVKNYRRLEEELQREQREAVGKLEKAKELIDRAEKTVIERTEWARSLDRELEATRAQLSAVYASPAYRFGRRLRLAPDPPEPDPRP